MYPTSATAATVIQAAPIERMPKMHVVALPLEQTAYVDHQAIRPRRWKNRLLRWRRIADLFLGHVSTPSRALTIDLDQGSLSERQRVDKRNQQHESLFDTSMDRKGHMATVDYPAILGRTLGDSVGVHFPDLPGCVSSGKTMQEAVRGAKEALNGHLAVMAERGDPIPAPSAIDDIEAAEGIDEIARVLVRAERPG